MYVLLVGIVFVNVSKVACDLVHDCVSVRLSLCLEQVHVYRV